nr:DUF3422 domain-containing protein [uncultured Devosia sp.]
MATPLPIDHPYRQAILAEVHARPIDIVPEACRVRRLVFVMPSVPGAMMHVFQAFEAFCIAAGHPAPMHSSRQYSFETESNHVTWEFHTEFVTLTWRSTLDDWENWPEAIGLDVLAEGQLIGAMRIDVTTDTTVPDKLVPGFNLPSLCLADIENGNGQVATDFVPDAEHFTRFELAAGRLTVLRRSIVVRRLLEVETYRTMALLGLPLAREVAGDLRGMEFQLTSLVESMSAATSPAAVQQSLSGLHALSVRSGQLSERLGYRFAAGQAYGEILRMRLANLRENSTVRGSTLTHYVGNRVDPGLATCAAMEKRLTVVSDKIERAIGLLDVRIGVDIQMQNAAVLDSIAQTARSQFLLQRTVEGLSTIAISYYLLGIVGYLLAGPLEELHWEKNMTLSVAAPFVVLAAWLMARGIRRAHAPTGMR